MLRTLRTVIAAASVLVLIGCSSTKTQVSAVAFEQPEIADLKIGSISITDARGINGDTEVASRFLVNISNELGLPCLPDSGSRYLIDVDFRERTFFRSVSQISAVTLTLKILDSTSGALVYQGILISEGEESVQSSILVFEMLRNAFSELVSAFGTT